MARRPKRSNGKRKMPKSKGVSKRRKLVSGPLANVARSGGRVARLASAAMGVRRIWDSAGSANRQMVLNKFRGLASKAKRKLNFDETKGVEGVALTRKKLITFNIGGKQQLKLQLRDRPLWNKVVSTYAHLNRGGINSVNGAFQLHNVNDSFLPIDTYDMTYKGWLAHGEDYINHWRWKMQQGIGWIPDPKVDESRSTGNVAYPAPVYTDNGPSSTVTSTATTWLDQKYDIKLLLYGRAKQSTEYKIIFWRVDNEELNPQKLSFGIDGSWEQVKQTFLPLIQPYTTNPASITFNRQTTSGKTDKKVKILKTFTYKLKEQLSTEDSVNRINVNFRVFLNKLKSHRYNQGLAPVTDITDVDQPVITDLSQLINATRYCTPQQRVYMSIIGSCIEVEGQTNYEAPSYDLAVKTSTYASAIH